MLLATLTNNTCGEACWHAVEDVCRCSCGGANHGCLRDENGKRPVRTARIDGAVYELQGVGNVEADARRLNAEAGISFAFAHTARQHYGYKPVALMRPANQSQLAKWPELRGERERVAKCEPWDWRGRTVYLLWVRVSREEVQAA